MVLLAWDNVNQKKVQIDMIPYKSNDIFSYKKRKQQCRYKCLDCGSVLSEVDPYTNISKHKKQYSVKRHFRCNNKDCNKELKDKRRYNICKKGQTVADIKKNHEEFVKKWLMHFDYNLVYLNEGLKIPDKNIIILFSHCLITFDIVKKLVRENKNYKIIIVFDEDTKVREITEDPEYYEDEQGNGLYSIYLPKKNDIQYCLEHNFDVYLDTNKDVLIQLKDNRKLNDSFDCKLVDINDFTFRTGIYTHQTKAIIRNDFSMIKLFEIAHETYQLKIQREIEMKIDENERKAWRNARR